jgi:hypothetical protein
VAKRQHVLRVGVGTPEEPFAPPWRFWTYGDSAYFSQRVLGGIFKCSFHPAKGHHNTAVWTAGFTTESGVEIEEIGGRRSHTWQQPPEFLPGWYRGPSISIPRLDDRPYDLPPMGDDLRDLSDAKWIDAPQRGHARFLTVFLSDGRPDLPPLELGEGDDGVDWLPMADGWHLSVVTAESPLRLDVSAHLKSIRDDVRVGLSEPVETASASGAVIWVTTSPDGPALFVQVVLGSDNFFHEPNPDPDPANR